MFCWSLQRNGRAVAHPKANAACRTVETFQDSRLRPSHALSQIAGEHSRLSPRWSLRRSERSLQPRISCGCSRPAGWHQGEGDPTTVLHFYSVLHYSFLLYNHPEVDRIWIIEGMYCGSFEGHISSTPGFRVAVAQKQEVKQRTQASRGLRAH